ncbi:hypothetical protein AAC691_19710 [Nguyenibacter vanlangensis]|uniref:Uncharacterized protein n=1 Tax=Nguyenibacter vanlangensis TaxID=1216886 RepID=A0ABZ3D3V7_9PROT
MAELKESVSNSEVSAQADSDNELLSKIEFEIKKISSHYLDFVTANTQHLIMVAPHRKDSSTSKILSPSKADSKKVQAVRDAALELQKALKAMPADDPAMILRRHVEQELASLLIALRPPPAHAGRGRPRNDAAAYFTDEIYQVFMLHTGTKPTMGTRPAGEDTSEPYGPFYDFVTKLFGIFGVKASAENQAREAIARMEKKLQ